MVVNGEKVWVPNRRQDLITGLKRMGVDKYNGRSLRSASGGTAPPLLPRAGACRARQRQQPPEPMRTYQSQLLAAWSVTD